MDLDDVQRRIDALGFPQGDVDIEQPRSLQEDLEVLSSDPESSGIRADDSSGGLDRVPVKGVCVLTLIHLIYCTSGYIRHDPVDQSPILKESANREFKAGNFRKAIHVGNVSFLHKVTYIKHPSAIY
jgi:hypothetical protein